MKRVAFLMAAILALSFQPTAVRAQSVRLTYQGRVTDAGTNFTGSGQFKFALVTSTNYNITAQAVADPPSGGFITIINVTVPGAGYSTAPAVTISGGGGTGATAHASIGGGSVTSITVDNPGHGYTSTPSVIVAPPPINITYTTYWSNDGTSSGGSQPTAAVPVTVTGGLFTVLLGDTTLPNMDAIDASLFNNPSLQLRIWFSDGAQGFAALDPAQSLTPAPYAVASVSSSLNAGGSNPEGSPNVLEGSTANTVSNTVVGATIGGGGATNAQTEIFTGYLPNSVSGDYGTVSGGLGNAASELGATVGGGAENIANGPLATVSGGNDNAAKGQFSTVPGGFGNSASGDFSFAAGFSAFATNQGSFVWADFTFLGQFIIPFRSAHDNSFNVRATGGTYIYSSVDGSGNPAGGVSLPSNAVSWSSISDRNAKKNFQPVNGESVLEKLASIPVQKWNYKWERDTDTPNIGPMAQDFKAAFYPGRDNKSISTLEFDGVELAAIQGLNAKLKEKEAEIADLKTRLERLERLLPPASAH